MKYLIYIAIFQITLTGYSRNTIVDDSWADEYVSSIIESSSLTYGKGKPTVTIGYAFTDDASLITYADGSNTYDTSFSYLGLDGYTYFELNFNLSRSGYPLGYVDGMSLYNGYFAERFNMDPMGERERTTLEEAIYAHIDKLIATAKEADDKDLADKVTKFRDKLFGMIKKSANKDQDPDSVKVTISALTYWHQDDGNTWGEGVWDSDNYNPEAPSYVNIPASQYKCNIYVGEVYYKAKGLEMPIYPKKVKSGRTRAAPMTTKYFPPRARDWGNPKFNIDGKVKGVKKGTFIIVKAKNAQMGDVIAFGGHVGIYLAPNLYISARDTNTGSVTGKNDSVQKSHGIQIKTHPTDKADSIRRYLKDKK